MVAVQSNSGANEVGHFSRMQMVELIMSLNPTASPGFLSQFADTLLRGYLEHLMAVQEPRGRSARWLRPADSPAIVSKEASE